MKRIRSKKGIYHAIARGVNKQDIFEEDQDYKMFLRQIIAVKKKTDFSLLACCLMGNHFHFLIMEKNDKSNISDIMREIQSRYVQWYNEKNERTGHLFEGRFVSEPVDTEDDYKRVFCYIHRNPIKAGLEQKLGQYRWNSLIVYIMKKEMKEGNIRHQELLSRFIGDWSADGIDLIDVDYTEMIFGSFQNALDCCQRNTDEVCIDIDKVGKVEMAEIHAKNIIQMISGCKTVTEFQALTRKEKRNYVSLLYKNGLSKSQIRRHCGVSQNLIDRATTNPGWKR